MENYKLVASDLDGTLFDNQAEVSRENFAAINTLWGKGVHFVPSSGRTLSEIRSEIKDNPKVRYIIYSNGAAVFDKETGERILTCISKDVVKRILDVLYTFETHITYRYNGESFVDAAYQTEKAYDYYNVCEEHQDAVQGYANYVNNFKELGYSADQLEVISVFFRNYEDQEACKQLFSKWGELRVVESAPYNLEIVSRDAGKGNALRCLADKLCIDYADTISIGNSNNDESMIKAAGLGLAVLNSCESLKKAADEIICSNEEHVIDYVLKHYFL